MLLLAGSIYMMLVYDLVIPGRSEATLAGLLFLVIAAYSFQAVLEVIRGRVLVHMAGSVNSALEDQVHGAVVNAARRLPEADANQPVRDLDQIRGFLAGAGPTAFVDLPWVLFFVAILFLLHPWIGVTVLVGAAVLVALTFLTDRITRPGMEQLLGLARTRQEVVDTSRRHAEALYAMGMEHRLRDMWRRANHDYLAVHTRISASGATLGSVGKVSRMLLQSIVLSVGAVLVIENKASAGVIFASSILSSRALAPIELVIANWRGYVSARKSWERLKQAFAHFEQPAPVQPLPLPRSAMSAEVLSLTAAGGKVAIVQNVSLLIFAGEAVAIMGPSGSGKSTLMRGLAGILPAASGSVRLDGAELDQWPRDVLGRSIGYLPQNVELLHGTVAENIARFQPDADMADVIHAAKQAGVHDMIQHFPDGYNSDVGPDGRFFSAGQRQRIALARALFGDPFLILLDEPNSNLDDIGEAALIEAIRAAKARGAIVIAVAHRPAILQAIDNILLLNAGRAQAYERKDRILQAAQGHAVIAS
ncbi:hypothetical protein BFL28_05725 [Sphingomonas turrisvirgatae]|uniref:Type I secretion protein n=1 Tax=Sphingomonas turrisvirgatae TaxID=1888892 RepID=A0A1E3LS25_9SPHN|nr:hypothetical protein BFL28_05725 [Sphingomonas turrisvirgatae]